MATKNAGNAEQSLVKGDILRRFEEGSACTDTLIYMASYEAQSRISIRTQDFERAMGASHDIAKSMLDALEKKGLLTYKCVKTSAIECGTSEVYTFRLTDRGREEAKGAMVAKVSAMLGECAGALYEKNPTLWQAWKILEDVTGLRKEFAAMK